MSEQNILNPTQASLFNPDWGYTEGLPEMRSVFQAASGKMFSRRQQALGRIYDLAWNNRDLATKHALQQLAQQYENDFFSLADWERGRYFSGRFEGPLAFSPVGNQRYNIRGRFIELPGLAMFAYPTNWARDAIFLEERNGFGEDLVKLTGSGWVFLSPFVSNHGGDAYRSINANDTAEWLYFGYNFRYWALSDVSSGIVELSLDGAVVATLDLYSAAALNAAPVFTSSNVKLGFHRVKVRVTGTKNASATNFWCYADAIEVMQ